MGCEKGENSEEESDGQTEENERQNEEDKGQTDEDDGETEENMRQKMEDEGHKEDYEGHKEDYEEHKEEEGVRKKKENNDGKKSNEKSIDNQGLPVGWSRLSVQRKNGTHVDYYLVNQQGKKFRSQKEVDRWLQDKRQDLKVSLKPLSKKGQDIRRMFNDPKRTAFRGEKTSPQQDMPKSQKGEQNVVKRISPSPCIVGSVDENLRSDCKAERVSL